MWTRRSCLRKLLWMAPSAALLPWPALAASLPASLAEVALPGATLAQESDPANSANKLFRVAGTLPSGEAQVQAFQGTRLFDMRLPGDAGDSDSTRKRIVSVLQHYDNAVAKLGGKRLNQGFDAKAWTDINARMHLYTRPSAAGEVSFGLWIQDGGMTHWLLLFPASDARAAANANELAARIANVGHAPVYIHFDTNQATLKPQAATAVQQIVALMKASPDWKLTIEGHTDDVGQAADNQNLSQARAEAVLKAVVAQGIDASRLTAAGRGAGQPVASNRTEEGRALNRRVELVKRVAGAG